MQTQRSEDRILALFLAAIAGCVNAVAFIELGGFFVSFMSGNSTRLGVALGQHNWATAGFAFGLMALFVGGVAAGQLLGRRFDERRAPVLLAVVAVLLAAAATLYGRGGYPYAPPLLALAMGMLNTVLARDGTPAFGVGYMTGTLVRIGTWLAQPAPAASPNVLMLDLVLWLAFVAGGAGGAAGDSSLGGTVLEVPAIAALVLGLWRWVRR